VFFRFNQPGRVPKPGEFDGRLEQFLQTVEALRGP
jgi:hypothetical protein